MVAVALHLAAHGIKEAALRVGRVGEAPRGVRLLVHHEPEPVAVVELARRRLRGDEPHAVVARRLHVLEVAELQLRRGGVQYGEPARQVIAGVRALEEDALPVEREPALLHPEVAEAEARRIAADRERVDVRRVDAPELESRNVEGDFEGRLARRQGAPACGCANGMRGVVQKDDARDILLARRAGVVPRRNLDRHAARLPVRLHEGVRHAHGRHGLQRDGQRDAARVVAPAGLELHLLELVAVRHGLAREALDLLLAGVDHAYGK